MSAIINFVKNSFKSLSAAEVVTESHQNDPVPRHPRQFAKNRNKEYGIGGSFTSLASDVLPNQTLTDEAIEQVSMKITKASNKKAKSSFTDISTSENIAKASQEEVPIKVTKKSDKKSVASITTVLKANAGKLFRNSSKRAKISATSDGFATITADVPADSTIISNPELIRIISKKSNKKAALTTASDAALNPEETEMFSNTETSTKFSKRSNKNAKDSNVEAVNDYITPLDTANTEDVLTVTKKPHEEAKADTVSDNDMPVEAEVARNTAVVKITKKSHKKLKVSATSDLSTTSTVDATHDPPSEEGQEKKSKKSNKKRKSSDVVPLVESTGQNLAPVSDETADLELEVAEEAPKIKAIPIGWDYHFAALLEYGRLHGTCNVPYHTSFDCVLPGQGGDGAADYHYDGKLGYWLSSQRQAHKDLSHPKRPKRLAKEEKLQQLVNEGKLLWEAEGISAVSKKQGEIDWPRHYAALLQFYNEHGTCNVPSYAVFECILPGMGDNGDDYRYHGKLGSWLRNQRQSRRGKNRSKITPEREALLQVLVDEGKFYWKCDNSTLQPSAAKQNTSGTNEWKRHYAALLKYYEENGTCNVPCSTIYECNLEGMGDNGEDYFYNRKLGTWLNNQRKARKGVMCKKLLPEREAQLQTLVDEGKLVWAAGPIAGLARRNDDTDWSRHYAALLSYFKEYGTCNVPQTTFYECELLGMGENGANYHYTGNLGFWLKYQREAKRGLRTCPLTGVREARLQQLVDEGKLLWEFRAHELASSKEQTANSTV